MSPARFLLTRESLPVRDKAEPNREKGDCIHCTECMARLLLRMCAWLRWRPSPASHASLPIGASKSPSCPSLKPWAPLSKRTPCRKRGGFETEPVSCRCQKFSKISALVYFLYEVANIADFGKLVACIDAMVADSGMGGASLPPSRSQHASRNLPSPQCG
jgi:hypothetical protein